MKTEKDGNTIRIEKEGFAPVVAHIDKSKIIDSYQVMTTVK